MRQYKEMIEHIINSATYKDDRTGVGTISTFGYQTRFDLSEGFPLVGLKKTPFRLIAEELMWFISGSDMLRDLLKRNVHIWDEWGFKTWYDSEEYAKENRPKFKGLGAKVADSEKDAYDREMKYYLDKVMTDDGFSEKYGCLRRVYGKQWREWRGEVDRVSTDCYANGNFGVRVYQKGIDQLADVIERIKTNPDDRRLIVSAWNPTDITNMALPPCHSFFQFYVKDGKLSCQLYQRSADTFLGVPFNIASYALLTHMVAHVCNLEVGDFVHTFGDLHLYNNQLDGAKELLKREIRPMPKLIIKRKVDSIDDFTIDDFEIVGYNPHPPIKVEVAV